MFEGWCIERIPQYMYNASAYGVDYWMTDSVKKDFLAWNNSEEKKRIGAIKKGNRLSGVEDGKAYATHAMGRISNTQFIDNMAANDFEGKQPPATEVVKRAQTTKSGKFVSEKFSKLFEDLSCRQNDLEATQPDTPANLNKLYYETVGGHDNKGRVFGMGKATAYYYDQPAGNSSTGKRFNTYAPGLLTKMTNEIESQNERLAILKVNF